ncbi:MAG TPA: PadR family transcriptional regulator [Pseudonocardiaceae bacterium]|jgi:DNA-binding PadR family transcriptional regulator|nr:PadR family transcriptional regulator [Pseudonocardiaceae bacterium]
MRNAGRATLTAMGLAVLECLHECPRHPYDIHQTMQEHETWRLVKLTTGSLYHTIERLAEDGLIEVVETSRAGRRPERTIYRVTDAGRDAFAARLRAMIADLPTEYPQYPVAVGFMHELQPEDALFQLRRRTLALEAQLAADRVVEAGLTEEGIHPLYWADAELRRRYREAELEFTRDLIDRVATGRVTWPAKTAQAAPHTERQHSDPPGLSLVDEGNQENVG